MIEAQLNMFDMVVLGVLGLSALVAFFRGFVREVLSLGAWVGAVIITLYGFPEVAKFIKPHVGNSGVASGFAGMLTFMGSLVVLSIINAFLMKFLKPGNEVGIIDNALGLVFGVARGLLLVSIGFYVMSFFISDDDYPEWLEGAKTKPYVEEVAGWMAKLAPEYLGGKDGSKLKPKKDGPITDMLESLPAPSSGTIFDAEGARTPERLPDGDNQAAREREEIKRESGWPSMDELRRRVDEGK